MTEQEARKIAEKHLSNKATELTFDFANDRQFIFSFKYIGEERRIPRQIGVLKTDAGDWRALICPE